MFWWRHAGGLTSESPTGGCPPKGDSLSSRVPPHLPTDVEEGQSAACGSRILGNVRERRKGGLDAFHGAHRRVAGWEPPGASVRRCLTSSPTRGRSRLQTRSSSLYSSDLRKFCQKGIDIVNRTGSRSPTSGSDWLSLRSEEYFSACSDSLNSPTASDGKEMSFATRTASSQSDAGNSIEPLHRRSLSNRSCLHTTSTRVVWGRADRLRSAPDGRAGASFRTALVPARSFSLPLLGPPVLKATPSGAPSASFRCISSSPFDFGEGEEESKPLHEQVKALAAPAFLDTHRGATNSRPTPYPLHEASQRISREEVSRLGEYRKPGVHIGSFPHYGLCVAPETGDADERGGSWSPSEFEAFPEGLGRLSLIANLATSDGPAETRDLPSLRLFSNGCYRKATEANRVGELQAGKRTSGGIRRSASFRTPATDVFGSTRCDRRSRSWTALNTRSSSYRLLPAFNSSEQLPFLLANAASSVRRNSQTAIGGSSDCRTYKEDSKSFASIGELPANGAGDVDGRRRFEATREEEVGSKQEKAEALRIAEAELETRSVRQGGIHDADTLQLLERGSCGAGTGPCADGLQASSLSHPDVHMESSNTVAECVGAFASALSNGDASGVSAAVAVASQQQNADLARETVSGTNHAGKELQAPAVVRHTECGEVPRGGLTTQQPLQRPFVDMAALFPIGLLPKQRQRDAVIACNHPLGDQKEHKAHGSPPLQATRFSCAVGLSTEEANAPTSEVLFGSAGRGSCGDAQENQARQRMLASADEPAASIDSSLSPGLDTAQVNISFHDAWPVAIGEAEEPKRRTSRASEGGMNCRNRQEPQTRQWSLPASVEGAAPLHWSNLGFLQEATAPDDRFQDAVNGSPGKAEEPQRELSRASEGGKGRGNPQKPQTRQWSLPASAGGAVSLPCSSLGLLEEAGTADESLQDMMKGAVGEAEVRDREVLRGSEGGNVGEDTQNLQTRQESLAALLAGAGPLPCSSLGFSREIGEADESFHNASGVAVGEAEEPKREASRASEGGRRRRNTQEPQTRQRSLPVSVKKAVSPTWSSLGFAREATAQSDGFHDAIDGFVGEAGEPKRWASHGNESGSGCGSPQTVRTRQGSLLASVEGAGAIPYSSLGFLQEAATPDEGFQDAINGSPGEAEEPQRGLSRASEGGKGRGNLQKPQTRQWSLPASVVGAVSLPCSSLGLSEKAEVADESLQDAKNGAVGEAEVRDHEALRGRRHRSGGLDTQEPQPKQGTFLAIAERTVSLPCSSLGFPRETGLADASFEDAIGGVFVEDREREHEAFRSSEGGNVDGDTQKPQKRQGSLPTLLAGAGLLPCSRMGLAGEAWAADEGFQDAINGAVGEAEERDREALRSSEGGDVGKDAQDLQERQESLPAVLAGAGSLPCSSLGLAGEAWVADEGFQDAINGAVGEAEERDHEMLRGSEGGNVGGDTQNLQTRQGSPPALSAWAGSLPRSCLSFSGETGAADASFHSASGVAVGEDEAPKREASHASEGGRRRRNTQEPQKRQGSLPASDARAVGLPWTSLGFSREAEEADASFQDAINGAVGEAEERDREALRSSEGGDVGKDAQDLQERQESLPAVLAGAGSLPCSSLGLAGEAWVADEGFQDALNGSGGEAEELKREALRGSQGGRLSGELQELGARRGPQPVSVGAVPSLWGILGFAEDSVEAGESFQDAVNEAGGEAEEPKHEASLGIEKRCLYGERPEVGARQRTPPVGAYGAGVSSCSPVSFSGEDGEADESFHNSSGVTGGEAEEPKRRTSRASEGGVNCRNRQEPQTRQWSLPANVYGPCASSCSSLAFAGKAATPDEGFQDAANEASGEAEEPKRELSRASEGGKGRGNPQKSQTRQGSLPVNLVEVALLHRSSSDFSRLVLAPEECFHDAVDVAGGEAEEPKRELPLGSGWRGSSGDTPKVTTRRGAQPVSLEGVVASLWSSLGFAWESGRVEESFQDALNGAGGEEEEPKREGASVRDCRSTSGDRPELRAQPGVLLVGVDEAVSLPCSSLAFAREDTALDESFHDASNGAGGETEEPQHETPRGSERRRSSGDKSEVGARQGAPPLTVYGAGASSSSPVSFSGEDGAADESFHDATGVAVGEAEGPKREASRASEGGRDRGNTQEPQTRQESLTKSGGGACVSSCSSLGFSREAVELDEGIQNVFGLGVGEAEELKLKASFASEGRARCDETGERGERQGTLVKGGGCEQNVEPQDASNAAFGNSESPSGSNGNSSLGELQTGQKTLQNRTEAPTGYPRLRVASFNGGAVSDWCECAPDGCGEDNNSEMEHCGETMLSTGSLYPSVRIFREAHGFGCRDDKTQLLSGAQSTDHEPRKNYAQQQLRQVRCLGEKEPSALQIPPSCPFGSPSRRSETVSSCNCASSHEVCNRRHDDTLNSDRAFSRDTNSCCICKATEQYYIGSRGSSEGSSSSNSSDHEGSCSGSESCSSSYDSSRSSCSSCCSEERSDQSSESAQTNISRDSSVYEKWSSCREFPSRAFGQGGDAEPSLGAASCPLSSPVVSIASRALSQDNTELDEESRTLHELKRTQAQISPRYANYEERPTVLPLHVEGLEGKEAAQRQEVHAGICVSSPVPRIVFASSSQASLSSRQPLGASHWSAPALGLAAALSSLAQLVFTSREPCTSPTRVKGKAPFPQARGVVNDRLTAAAPEERIQEEHLSADAHSRVQGAFGACQEKLTTNDGRLAARGLEEDPSRADVASASNAETGVLRRSLKSRLRGRFIGERLRDVQLDGVKSFLWHFGAGVALRGNSVPETAAAEECLAIREGSEGHHISTDDAKKRSFSTSTSSSRKGIQLSKRQNALTMLHGFGRKDSALWRHSGSLHLPHKAQWMCSSMPAEGEQFTAEPWPLVLPRRGATSSSAFGPTHSNVDRRQIRESFTSKFSEGLAEGGVNSSGPRSSDGNLFKSSMSSAEKVSSFSSDRGDLSKLYAVADGDRSCLVYRTLPLADSRCVLSRNMERPVARKRSISSEDSHYSQTGCGCGLHLVPDGAAKRHLTADPPGRRSFSATHVDFQFDGRTHTRWGSWGTLRTAHGGAAIPHMDFQRMHPGNGYAVQPTSPRQSDSSVPMLARANSIGWGGSEPLDMAATHRILESAVEFALHKQPQGRACQISGDRLRKEKLKMLLGGAGDKEPSKARRPGVPASASADSLVAHHTPIVYKGTMKKRLALHQPALACRMPLNIFCGNFLSASSLWTLQLRRPFASEEGERQLFSRSSSEDFGKEESGRGGLQQNEGYSTQEETFRSASSGETLPTPSVQPAKRLSCSPLNPLVQELLGFSSYEFGSAPDIRRSTVVEHSGCPTAKTSQSQAREESSELNSNTMPKPRRPWACGEPVSVAQDESRSAVRTYIHRPGCRCSLCLPAWGVAGHSGGAPVERHGDTYSSLEIPTPRLQAGLPVVPSPPGGYAAASPMRIFSSPLGPYPGYGPGNGNAIRVESPTRVQYGVGERVTAPPSYFDHQGGKFSIPTVQSVYPVEGLQTPRVQTVSCNQPVRQTQSSHPSASYPLTADENYQKGYSQGRQACVPSDTPTRDPLHSKSPISAVSSRDVSFDESEKLRVQQEQQQKEADELRRRQEELEKEQKKLREELELERQQLKEQRERLEEQRQAFEQEKQELLHAQLLATSKGRSRGLESSSSVGKGSPERLPVNNTEDAFDLPRNTAARTQHGPPIRHTTSTSNIVRSITGSGFGELQSDTRHGGSAVDADGTEEKASNAVAGRPQSLHPTASCARFFSRTASVDTNDEKEPALSLQDDLQTDPSMALSTALDKLAKIRMKLETLQQQLEVQSQEVTSYYSALKAADQVHSSLQQTAADCRVCYGRRHTQMQEVEKRLIVLTAQDLHPCSVDELEELAQELEGTQYKLTVVQAQRAGGSAEESHKKPKQLLPYSSSCLPDPKSSFAIPEEPVARIGPEECAAVQESALQEIKALGDDLEHIKAVHSEYKKAYKRLQGTMTQQINSYDVDLQRLIAIEKNLEEKLRRLLFLNGDANYAELSDAQMQEYFRLVNLSIRKVYREIALRESGDRKRNEPRTSGSLNSRGSHAGSHQHHLDARDNEPNGAHRLGGDAVASSFSPPGHNVERSQAHGHNFQGNLGAARNCCNPVHVPFVAGSRASSIAAQRMLAHDSRLAPRQTSVERASSREKFHHRWLAETESHASKVLDE